MVLHALTVSGRQGLYQVKVEDGCIQCISPECDKKTSSSVSFSFGGATLYPGLINSHDHLDFNSFPQLGNRIYGNYSEWGFEIHQQHGELIKQVLNIPQELRIRWGLYKNLLNGFTTVVNHGSRLQIKDELTSVFQESYPLHSPAFEKNWKWKLNNPFRKKEPIVMHIGEGTDELARSEVAEVVRHNRWNREMVAVHGVAMAEEQAGKFSGLVWCPASNYFLLGNTAAVKALKNNTSIVFGTDSTLTGSWNAWEHFRQAIHSEQISEEGLISSLTEVPAKLWKMNDRGEIAVGQRADLLILGNDHSGYFSDHNPQDILMVMHKGKVRLIDDKIIKQADPTIFKGFSRISISNAVKWVQGDLPLLGQHIQSYYPDAEFPFKSI